MISGNRSCSKPGIVSQDMGVLVAGIAPRNSLRDLLPDHGIISAISKGYGGGGGVGNSLDPYTLTRSFEIA